MSIPIFASLCAWNTSSGAPVCTMLICLCIGSSPVSGCIVVSSENKNERYLDLFGRFIYYPEQKILLHDPS